MLGLQELLAELDYDQSPYYRRNDSDFEPETVHLFRAAREINVDGGVDGIYVFETSPQDENNILPAQPAVYIATAKTEEDAKEIHRSLWNLCYAPFLIITLPHQIRIYTGFNYSPDSENVGLLVDPIDTPNRLNILKKFAAIAIDSKQIWQSSYGKELNPNRRVDKRLLQSLQQLGNVLKTYGLRSEVAHALIGKYVYFSYLRDRNILSDEWLNQQGIEPQDVFSYRATVPSLRKLTDALEDRFNGKIFPIHFDSEESLVDEHVSWVASVFKGDSLEETPEIVRQFHLPFRAYNFKYIPVETLSTIYEQFIHERKKKGAIYTPEILADYLLSEMEWAKELKRGMRILDPACGSGVFLVLAYRRLIEKELDQQDKKKLRPEALRNILMESIYGVEKELDACLVTEFSLILTLLHYVEPRELHKNLEFQFPSLHNERIFQGDFFDPESLFAKQSLKFDWIAGNPPWIKADKKEQLHANQWILKNSGKHPVGDKSVAESFSWHVSKFLNPDGLIGLLMPATSLVNLKSKPYRQQFFHEYEVLRITNFANLREVIFDKRGTLPTATFIYRPAKPENTVSSIIHYGPFTINQVADGKKRPWVITINENEIQTVDLEEAILGKTITWKLALWGSKRDQRALERLSHLFPKTLEDFCEKRGWGSHQPRQGAELNLDTSKPLAKVKGFQRFDTQTFDKTKPRHRFSISNDDILKEIAQDMYIRRGEDTLNLTTPAPHLILSKGWKFVIYSERDFIIPPQQMGISVPKENYDNAVYLKAIAVFLNSSIVAYHLFFHVPEWGFFRQRGSVVTSEVRKIPIPDISLNQARELAEFHDELVVTEQQEFSRLIADIREQSQKNLDFGISSENNSSANLLGLPNKLTKTERTRVEEFTVALHARLQAKIDHKVAEVFEIPKDISLRAKEFVNIRLNLDKPSALGNVLIKPDKQILLGYAKEIRDELDSFTMEKKHHRISINYSDELIECVVEMTDEREPIPVTENNIRASDLTTADLYAELSHSLKQQISQWVYVQHGLRLFDGPRIYIYKTPRLIDWTRTQAIEDASDIIGTALAV